MRKNHIVGRMESRSELAFRFDGGMAAGGELDLYQAGRYRYAAARLLYTVEAFRQRGLVLERLSSRINADFRVRAPQAGSFFDPIIVAVAPLLGDNFLRLPFEKILTWAFDQILPKANHAGRLEAILEKSIESQIVREKTAQSAEKTRRSEIAFQREQLQLIRELVGKNDILSQRAVLVKKKELSSEIVQENRDEIGSLGFALDELESEQKRHDEIVDYESTIEAVVGAELRQKLVSRIRKIVPELTFPLHESADMFSLIGGNDNIPLVVLNRKRVEQINKTLDGDPFELTGDIIRFDKQTRYGRIILEGQKKPLSFRIDPAASKSERDDAIRAMLTNKTRAVFVPVLDGAGTVVLLKLQYIVDLPD